MNRYSVCKWHFLHAVLLLKYYLCHHKMEGWGGGGDWNSALGWNTSWSLSVLYCISQNLGVQTNKQNSYKKRLMIWKKYFFILFFQFLGALLDKTYLEIIYCMITNYRHNNTPTLTLSVSHTHTHISQLKWFKNKLRGIENLLVVLGLK